MFTNSHSSSSWLIFVISYYLFIISLLLSTSSIVSGYNGYGPYVLGELTLPGRMEIDARCPKAFLDYRYNECRDDVRVDWSGTKNALKAECCYVLDDAHCIRESVKRNCPPEVLDFMDEILLSTESQWRYSTECHDYYKRSLCHFPIWAIVLLSIVGAILLFGCIGGIIYWKCCR